MGKKSQKKSFISQLIDNVHRAFRRAREEYSQHLVDVLLGNLGIQRRHGYRVLVPKSETVPTDAYSARTATNTSPTAERSEYLENWAYDDKQHYLNPYSIPFDYSHNTRIHGYPVSYNLLDSLYKYAGLAVRDKVSGSDDFPNKPRKGLLTPQAAVGLASLETNNGAHPSLNLDKGNNPDHRAWYNANLNTAFGFTNNPINNYRYSGPSPLKEGFILFDQGMYNPGEKSHTQKVQERGREAFLNPDVQLHYDNEGKYFYEGIYRDPGDNELPILLRIPKMVHNVAETIREVQSNPLSNRQNVSFGNGGTIKKSIIYRGHQGLSKI